MKRVIALGVIVVAAGVGAYAAVSAVASGAGRSERTEIGVRGEWTIEVRSAKGKLVTRRRFHNDLAPGAAQDLAEYFAATLPIGRWRISIRGLGPQRSPCTGEAFGRIGGGCGIGVPRDAHADFRNLRVTTPGTALELEGTAIADRDGFVGQVETSMSYCQDGTGGATCAPLQAGNLITTRAFRDPIALRTGQQLVVTVAISFTDA